MVLPKKKLTVSRKKVLSSHESSKTSSPRSLWQSKYEAMLPAVEGGAEKPSSLTQVTSTSKGLAVIVGNYNSDSESHSDSEMTSSKKEVDKLQPSATAPTAEKSSQLSAVQRVAGTTWIQCYDQNTGYPYFWNQATNEVSWQPPPECLAAIQLMKSQAAQSTARVSTTSKGQVKALQVIKKKPEKSANRKYPWQTGSDSEDEKIEMITSFGPYSEEESRVKSSSTSKKNKTRTKTRKETETSAVTGPQLPRFEQNDRYETSSLMTPLVADEGPPGVEVPIASPDSSSQSSKPAIATDSDSSSDDDCDVLTKLRAKAKLLQQNNGSKSPRKELSPESMTRENETEKADDLDLADAILAEIEKEVPPDIADAFVAPAKTATEKSTNSFALIASYGDDSDTEEVVETVTKPKLLFPSAVEPEATALPSTKLLFASVAKEPSPNRAVNNFTLDKLPVSLPLTSDADEEGTVSKAFQRKKRIEIVPAQTEPIPEASTSKSEPEPSLPVSRSNPRYNMDPSAGLHTGFGFTSSPAAEEKGKTLPIQFVKSETINFQPARTASPVTSVEATTHLPGNHALSQDLSDGAALLREKLAFLGEGKAEVSAIQLMAIQLETLFLAWQSGSLTPEYLCQWLGNRAIELLKNEQAAAPPGWICEWDREKKRYSYRNEATGHRVWEYPDAAEKTCEDDPSAATICDDSEMAIEEVEMEISTPPRTSPSLPEENDTAEPTTPPPPLISGSSSPPPPPPPPMFSGSVAKTSAIYPEFTPPLPTDAYPLPPDEPLPPGVDDVDLDSVPVRPPPPPLPTTAWVPPPPPPPDTFQSEYVIVGAASAKLERPPRTRKRSLVSELDSFYSDLAKMDESDAPVTCEETSGVSCTPEPLAAVAPPQPPLPYTPWQSVAQPSPPPSPQLPLVQEPPKKKKKSKLTPGLTLKKKGVSSLVAKWQQVREDAKRNASDDDEK